MKCPKCEKQNKPGVKNCEYCAEVMPVRKKKATTKAKTEKISTEAKTKSVSKTVKKSENVSKMKKQDKKVDNKPEIVKEPIIELTDEKKALKKFIKRLKKLNKMIYVYILLVISVLLLMLMLNNKVNTVVCTANHNSETEKYSITLKIKKNKNNIVNFNYVTKNTTNSYDKELKSRYEIIIDELEKKENFNDIVTSSLKSRSWEISYKFDKENLNKTSEYIGIDLTPYKEDVDSFVEELEKEIGFTCK